MELDKVSIEADKMLANFLNTIGLDGDWYASLKKTTIIWGTPLFGAAGEFIPPTNPKINILLSRCNQSNQEIIESIRSEGLIVINQIFRNFNSPTRDLFETLIHEKIHSNRLLLLHDAFRDGLQNEYSYSNNDGIIEQNTNEYSDQYVDASQQIFKGSIDTSNKTIQSYNQKSQDEIEDAVIGDIKIQSQMNQQHTIDEALVELMAELSYLLYYSKQNGQELDIWSAIEIIKNDKDDSYLTCKASKEDSIKDNVRSMCDLILSKRDLSLFYWMVDPISYSNGDPHYDFFSAYINDDKNVSNRHK